MKKPNGTYIYKNFWLTSDGYATDGNLEASTTGFQGGMWWLMERCGLPSEGVKELWAQREFDKREAL